MIQINFACDKDWDDMSPENGGRRFCESCSKSVSDYTNSTNPKNVKGCGRFNLSQVSKIKRQLSIPALSVYTASLLTVLGVTATDIKTLKAQEFQSISQEKALESKIKIKGIVKEKDNDEPVPFANVVLKDSNGTLNGTTTNFDGWFELEIDSANIKLGNLSLVFSYVGFEKDTLTLNKLNKEELEKELVINLETDLDFDNEVIIHTVGKFKNY